jgi:beta-barrel assembly-enhancing protease
MKKCALSMLGGLSFAVTLAAGAVPAHAQFGRLGDVVKTAEKAKKIVDIKVTDAEERQIGQQVSDKIVEDFGVYQDANVTKYVTLLGSVLTQASSRPNLDWQFVVLDTEGVNAFAAPGGFIHITKGMLGLMKNEAELAGVLAHEIVHITDKHTVNAIQTSSGVQMASDEYGSGGMAQTLVAKFADAAYKNIINNAFSRGDEEGADEKGMTLANTVGYAPNGLSAALTALADRNKDAKEPNGLFASHPQIKDRLAKMERVIKEKKLAATATVQARYAKYITFDAKPVTDVAMVAAGSRGLTGGEEKKTAEADKEKKEEKPKSGGGGLLGRLRSSGGSQAQQSQTVASAGGRAVSPDRDAVGGPHKKRVPVTIRPNDIAEFKKGIA